MLTLLVLILFPNARNVRLPEFRHMLSHMATTWLGRAGYTNILSPSNTSPVCSLGAAHHPSPTPGNHGSVLRHSHSVFSRMSQEWNRTLWNILGLSSLAQCSVSHCSAPYLLLLTDQAGSCSLCSFCTHILLGCQGHPLSLVP